MKFHHLVEKLSKYQGKISENIAKTVPVDQLPPDLVAKSAAADEWLQEADVKLGEAEAPTMAPNIDPMLDYSNALHLYIDMFDEKTKSEINEFEELVKELFDDVKNPDPNIS